MALTEETTIRSPRIRSRGPSMPFSVRRMSPADLDEVLAIERASFPVPWSRSAFEYEVRAEHARPLVMAQEVPPHVLGYLCAWVVADECHILNLAVHPGYRRLGLASSLIDHLFEAVRPRAVRRYLLEVRASNDKAIRLYRKAGFQVSGLRRRYYADTGEDALVMERGPDCC